MAIYVALLRAVNVGGKGKLPMADLKAICEGEEFREVQTYIASGNVVFASERSAAEVKLLLERRLRAYAGKPVQVFVRTAEELASVADANPFKTTASNRVLVYFLDAAPPSNTREGISGQKDEKVGIGGREVYVAYPSGMGTSKLRIPAAEAGTARNMNTVRKLVEMAKTLAVYCAEAR